MIEQGSTEWHAMRLGKVTASRINDVLARLKTGKEAASRANYKHQLMVERIEAMQKEVATFLDEVNQLCKQIESMKGKK